MTNWFADKVQPGVQQYVPGQQYGQPAQQQVIYAPPAQPQAAPQGSYQQQAAQLHQMHAIDAVAAWQGTRESRQGSSQCPKCGGPYFFTYANQGGTEPTRVMREDGTMVAPTGRCYTCAYNGRFEQLGQQATDLGVVLHT